MRCMRQARKAGCQEREGLRRLVAEEDENLDREDGWLLNTRLRQRPAARCETCDCPGANP